MKKNKSSENSLPEEQCPALDKDFDIQEEEGNEPLFQEFDKDEFADTNFWWTSSALSDTEYGMDEEQWSHSGSTTDTASNLSYLSSIESTSYFNRLALIVSRDSMGSSMETASMCTTLSSLSDTSSIGGPLVPEQSTEDHTRPPSFKGVFKKLKTRFMGKKTSYKRLN